MLSQIIANFSHKTYVQNDDNWDATDQQKESLFHSQVYVMAQEF